MDTIMTEADKLRMIAEAGPVGQRHTSIELYDLLAKCMRLANRCRSGDENAAMRKLVTQRGSAMGRNRCYVERGSDEFSLVCRYVFQNAKSRSAERSNSSRYAQVLRLARKRGLTPDTLTDHLKKKGGINALFLSRDLEAKRFLTKTLYLTSQIEVPKDGVVTLTIKRMGDNSYEVISCHPESECETVYPIQSEVTDLRL